MKIIIEGEPKEITALISELQERLPIIKPQEYETAILVKKAKYYQENPTVGGIKEVK